MFERLLREAPADHDVRMILSSNDPDACIAGLEERQVVRISREDLLRMGYPEKSRREGWAMSGNLDLVFLEFRNRFPDHSHYWFVEYDVHWEGVWSRFFEHFRHSQADVLGATMLRVDDVPHKEHQQRLTKFVVPPGMAWARAHFLKGFLPICRISREAFAALDAAYRAGLGGHYEFTLPSVAAQNGLVVEDFGGRGPFVRPENVDRFYFANGATYTHSPGNFVFRPDQYVFARPNTLWHPVKPGGVPAWHPLRVRGGPVKTVVEWVKPFIWWAAIWLWFATRWRPLGLDDSRQRPSSSPDMG